MEGKRFESWMYSLKILKSIKYQPIELQSSWQIKYQTSINGPMVSCLWIDRWREKKEKRKKKKEKRRMVLLEYMLCYSLVIGLNTKILKTSHHKST